MEKKTGVARSSASEGYIMKENMELWSHVQKNRVNNLEEGIQQLRSVYFLGYFQIGLLPVPVFYHETLFGLPFQISPGNNLMALYRVLICIFLMPSPVKNSLTLLLLL